METRLQGREVRSPCELRGVVMSNALNHFSCKSLTTYEGINHIRDNNYDGHYPIGIFCCTLPLSPANSHTKKERHLMNIRV